MPPRGVLSLREGRAKVPEPPRRCGLEAEAEASRADVVRKAVAAGGAVLGGGMLFAGLPRLAASATSPRQDVRVLNLILLLEQLKSAFYAEVVRKGRLTGELRRYARTVHVHEHAHLQFIHRALGGKARLPPTFDFGSATSRQREFTAAAITLEDLSVAAYNGQAANLTKDALRAAARIVSVEARHAAWIRDIAGRPPAAEPTDAPMSERQVREALEKTGFLR
jgi:ferritin-like protein